MARTAWNSTPMRLNELNISTTLACGQSFRWKELMPGEWTGVILDEVWKFKQTSTELLYTVFPQDDTDFTNIKDIKPDLKAIQAKPENHTKQSKKRKHKNNPCTIPPKKVLVKIESEPSVLDKHETTIRDYFQLNVNLSSLYKQWASADSNFEDISSNFTGIRILRQDPVENLYSFICSSNNHISRISSMVEKLCFHFGREITSVDGQIYYQFPEIATLAGKDVEQKLRDLGFGYRAKYIHQTSKYIIENQNEDWLYSLRDLPYNEAKCELTKLYGVGAKVADCVCLMSMDKPGSIPVDTHVWQIAARHYIPKLQQSKSLTDKLYKEIGDHFRNLWGEYAGWAHSVLFTADLKKFQMTKTDTKTKAKKSNIKKDLKREIMLDS